MIQLGDRVKDKVTGFEGIAVARTEWLYGCIRIEVQAKVKTNGEIEDARMFDEGSPQATQDGDRRGGWRDWHDF